MKKKTWEIFNLPWNWTRLQQHLQDELGYLKDFEQDVKCRMTQNLSSTRQDMYPLLSEMTCPRGTKKVSQKVYGNIYSLTIMERQLYPSARPIQKASRNQKIRICDDYSVGINDQHEAQSAS